MNEVGFRAIELLETAGDFFLGFCVLCGAAFVFMRSPRAALFVALAGAGLCAGVVFENLLTFVHMHGTAAHLVFTVTSVGRHVVFFGGLTLALRTLAKLGPA